MNAISHTINLKSRFILDTHEKTTANIDFFSLFI